MEDLAELVELNLHLLHTLESRNTQDKKTQLIEPATHNKMPHIPVTVHDYSYQRAFFTNNNDKIMGFDALKVHQSKKRLSWGRKFFRKGCQFLSVK